MLIRCEKCSTLYELDEKLLPRHGAPVQCSKCQHVFKAYPSSEQGAPRTAPLEVAPPPAGALGDELVREGGVLASAPPPRSPTPRPAQSASGPASVPPPRASSPRAPVPAPDSTEPQFTADGRPIRKVPFPSSEPQPPGTRPVLVAPAGAGRPTSGTPPWLRWVVPVVVAVVVLAAALLAWRLIGHRSKAPQQSPPAASSSAVVPSSMPPAGSSASSPKK